MSRLTDLVLTAIHETETESGARDWNAAASIVLDRAEADDLARLAREGALIRCKKAAEATGPATRRLMATTAQFELFPALRQGYAIDSEGRTVRLTGKLSRDEFAGIIKIRERQIEDDRAHLKALREAYGASVPIWDLHPEWTFGQCCDAMRVTEDA